jgi:hypothetical protein
MIRSLLIALSLIAAGPAAAQSHEAQGARTYTQADLWNRAGGRITFSLGGISLPDRAGETRMVRSVEASQEGRGLDNALLYMSPDEQVFATAYIYAPALPDGALTAFMTDYAIHLQAGAGFRTLRSGVVAAGGREGVAIRADYAGFRENRLASSAAFIRVGRWIVKLRVSGPEARRAEVEGAMNALLRDIRFAGRPAPAAITPITAPECRRAPERAARPVRSEDSETMEDAIMAHNLAGVEVSGGQSDEPGAPPSRPHWCRSAGYRIPDSLGPTPVLRDQNSQPGDDTRRSVLIALLSDSGTMIEVVERHFRNRTRFVVVHHQIGQTTVLGSYDSVPTDAQIGDIATGADRDGGRARATIVYQASGDSNVNVQVAPAPAVPRS